MQVERRRGQRFLVEAELSVTSADLGTATLVDLGPGGFSIMTPQPTTGDRPRVFRFATPDDRWSVELEARPVYFQLQPGAGGYRTGFGFLDIDQDEVQERVHALVGRALRVMV